MPVLGNYPTEHGTGVGFCFPFWPVHSTAPLPSPHPFLLEEKTKTSERIKTKGNHERVLQRPHLTSFTSFKRPTPCQSLTSFLLLCPLPHESQAPFANNINANVHQHPNVTIDVYEIASLEVIVCLRWNKSNQNTPPSWFSPSTHPFTSPQIPQLIYIIDVISLPNT